ncbi:MAG: tryptophan synthase subunit alpha [Candidatus Eisenbacteria bacterium]|uniref:Tryptophan synthase alpha chain n=1 Tax=Eiseniibacteriota bacterium TaxID=2212470 RepID=A0A849SCP6_UNCEI|nr:tryptophan synthase subunit alpha [Candidatus Eisenbacteria bacterium]
MSSDPPRRLARAFASRQGRAGLIPFLTAGYPDLESSAAMIRVAAESGALAIEIGIPFSDPIADGGDIQRSSEHAVRSGVDVSAVLELVKGARAAGIDSLPIVLMTYTNPVVRFGVERFAREARDAGADAVILSDLPPEESPEIWGALDAAGLDTVVLVAPTTPDARLPLLMARARGFAYCLARTGVTGAGGGEAGDVSQRIAAIRRHTQLPIAVGFGISNAEQARKLASGADAVIVGAAFMRAIASSHDAKGAIEAFGKLSRELAGALVASE